MRKIILVFAAVLLSSFGWSQTVTLKFKNGTTQQYSMSELESIDFADDGENHNNDNQDKTLYDVLQINGVSYACFGFRCFITFRSTWDLSKHSGKISLPCGKLSDAQKGEYDYDYMYYIRLKGSQDLEIGSKLENFSPTFEEAGSRDKLNYVSGSATVIDKLDDKYITIRFDSIVFGYESNSYTLDGTVQLMFDED